MHRLYMEVIAWLVSNADKLWMKGKDDVAAPPKLKVTATAPPAHQMLFSCDHVVQMLIPTPPPRAYQLLRFVRLRDKGHAIVHISAEPLPALIPICHDDCLINAFGQLRNQLLNNAAETEQYEAAAYWRDFNPANAAAWLHAVVEYEKTYVLSRENGVVISPRTTT
jgi:hypothetical protein